jgi:hypothetical protein
MCGRSTLSRMILPLRLMALTSAILSCAPAGTGPRACIDWPLDVCEVAPGTTVTVISHPRYTLRPGGRACLPSAGRVSAGGGIGGRSAHAGFDGTALLWA